MRPRYSFATNAVAVAAMCICIVLFAAPVHAPAQELKLASPSACHCALPDAAPGDPTRPTRARPWVALDENDEIATLEAIRVALTQVADGSAYVWYRENSELHGVVRPTASFKDAAGHVCRHIILALTAGERIGRIEGVACRQDDGRWALEG
jgi:hypothetical protein